MKLYLFLNNFICLFPRAPRAGSGVGAAKPPREPVRNLVPGAGPLPDLGVPGPRPGVHNFIVNIGPCGADVLPRARKAAQGLVLF